MDPVNQLIKAIQDSIDLQVNDILEQESAWKTKVDRENRDKPEVKRLEYLEKEAKVMKALDISTKKLF